MYNTVLRLLHIMHLISIFIASSTYVTDAMY